LLSLINTLTGVDRGLVNLPVSVADIVKLHLPNQFPVTLTDIVGAGLSTIVPVLPVSHTQYKVKLANELIGRAVPSVRVDGAVAVMCKVAAVAKPAITYRTAPIIHFIIVLSYFAGQ
jgi:hypothetical protein